MGCGAEFLELHPYLEEDEEHQSAIVLPPVCSLPPMTGSQRRIGVGNGDCRPLPPNPVCGFPATGSPVSCFHIGIGAPIDGLRAS